MKELNHLRKILVTAAALLTVGSFSTVAYGVEICLPIVSGGPLSCINFGGSGWSGSALKSQAAAAASLGIKDVNDADVPGVTQFFKTTKNLKTLSYDFPDSLSKEGMRELVKATPSTVTSIRFGGNLSQHTINAIVRESLGSNIKNVEIISSDSTARLPLSNLSSLRAKNPSLSRVTTSVPVIAEKGDRFFQSDRVDGLTIAVLNSAVKNTSPDAIAKTTAAGGAVFMSAQKGKTFLTQNARALKNIATTKKGNIMAFASTQDRAQTAIDTFINKDTASWGHQVNLGDE